MPRESGSEQIKSFWYKGCLHDLWSEAELIRFIITALSYLDKTKQLTCK